MHVAGSTLRLRTLSAWLLLPLLLVATMCSGRVGAQTPVELRVAAAADLTRAFGEIARVYERQTGQKVTLIFGSSGQLTQQISNGAPFDIFASASETYIDALDKQGLLVPGTRQRYATGKLILWSSNTSTLPPKNLADLIAPIYRHIAIANPDHAPYGLAAKQALQATGIWDKIQPKLVFGENIQQTYQFAATGNADVALISRSLINPDQVLDQMSHQKTDQTPDKKSDQKSGPTEAQHKEARKHIQPISTKLYAPLHQAMALLKSSSHREQGQQFLRFVTGREGQRLLQRYGFDRP